MNDLQREMDQIEKRTRRYWFADGLAEIAAGSAFLMVALYFLLSTVFSRGAPKDALNIVFPVLVIVVVFGARRATHLAKDRWVHPRTGYVSFEPRPRNRVANAVLGAIIAAALAFLASRAPIREWIPALMGLIFAAGFFVLGRKAGMLRFPIAGISCAVVGVLLSIQHMEEDRAAGLLFGWLGLVLIAGGTIALRAYLRHAPPQSDGRSGDGPQEKA